MSDKRPGVGCGLLLIKDGKVLLGHRHEDPEKADSELHGEGSWTCPGGKVDFGERCDMGLCRELAEETGIKARPEDLELFSVSDDMVEDVHFVTIGFLCDAFEGEPQVLEPDEIVEWKWFDIDDLPEPMFFPSQKMVDNYKDKIIYRK